MVDYIHPIDSNLFLITAILTGFGFLTIGWLKAKINNAKIFKSMFETFVLGAIAAAVAFYVGNSLEYLLAG